MKISESTARRIEISDVPGLDTIRAILEDVGPGQGRITIQCLGKAWSSYWGAMGERSVAQFFTACDQHYLAGKLSNIPSTIYDPDALIASLKREIFHDRRRRFISNREARDRLDAIEGLDAERFQRDPWSQSTLMYELLGDEWWNRLPEKPNPDYQYLCRIVETVRAALKSLVTNPVSPSLEPAT